MLIAPEIGRGVRVTYSGRFFLGSRVLKGPGRICQLKVSSESLARQASEIVLRLLDLFDKG